MSIVWFKPIPILRLDVIYLSKSSSQLLTVTHVLLNRKGKPQRNYQFQRGTIFLQRNL